MLYFLAASFVLSLIFVFTLSSVVLKILNIGVAALTAYAIYRRFYAAPAVLAEADAAVSSAIKPIADRAAEVEQAVEAALRDRTASKVSTPVAPVVPAAPEAPKTPTTPPTA